MPNKLQCNLLCKKNTKQIERYKIKLLFKFLLLCTVLIWEEHVTPKLKKEYITNI